MIRIVENIILLGTSHVAKQSTQDIKEAIAQYKPELVGIELDYDRFKHLMSKKKKGEKKQRLNFTDMVKVYGASGALFALFGSYVQQKIGEKLGVEPGLDMKAAYVQAREHKIPVSLIDQNIKITLKKISKLPLTKKVKLFGGLLFKSFKKEYRNLLDFDIKSGVPNEKIITDLIRIVKKEAPELYKILIHDRNVHMSNKLLRLRQNHDGMILAVVGAGHVEGMEHYLKDHLRPSELSFSFKVDVEKN